MLMLSQKTHQANENGTSSGRHVSKRRDTEWGQDYNYAVYDTYMSVRRAMHPWR